MLSNTSCMNIFIFLYAAVIFSIFVRASIKKKLIESYEKGVDKPKDWKLRDRVFHFLTYFKSQFVVMRQIKVDLATSTQEIKARYKTLQAWNALTMLSIFGLIMFSLVAHRVCG